MNKNNSRNKSKSKAQASMEYLMIVGFAMLLTAPLLLIYSQQTTSLNDHLEDSQANKVADKIIDTVNSVYYSGEGAKRTIKISFPENVLSVIINQKLLTLNMDSSHKPYEINRWTEANMTGSLNKFEGLHTIVIENLGTQISVNEG